MKNMVTIVFGLPGSGKSYFASRLAKLTDAVYINSDRVRKEMFEITSYSAKEKEAVYGQMLTRLKEVLKQGNNVVVDATFHKMETREPFINEMKDKGGIRFIEVWAAENIIRERLKRERPYSDADFNIYQLISKQNESLSIPHLSLESTNDNIDDMLLKATTYLKNANDTRTDQ